MNFPKIDCKIEMMCQVNPSEDPKKIKKSIANIFPYSKINSSDFSITAESNELRSLEKIHEAVHSKQSQSTYRRNLQKNLDNNTTWFYLNKQTAFVEKIVICDEANESPLGPIKVILHSSNLEGIIDWIVS